MVLIFEILVSPLSEFLVNSIIIFIILILSLLNNDIFETLTYWYYKLTICLENIYY